MIYSFNELYCKFETANFQTDSMAAGNTGFESGGVTCKHGALRFVSSSVLADSLVLRNPPLRQAPNCCVSDVKRQQYNEK